MSEEENVRVMVRVRPLSKSELEKGHFETVQVDPNKSSIIILNPVTDVEKTFIFDAVFSKECTQADIFNEVARPIIHNVIQGYNGTIIAYGQTGTGKTFSMEGIRSVPELKGIIPNSFAQIFSHISKESDHSKFLVRVSCYEIYNEDVHDLLAKDVQKKLEVKEKPGFGVYVKNLSSFVVRNEADMEKILKIGNKNRIVGSTNMNAKSSRSHAIFSILVECSTEVAGEKSLRMGKLNLVDLAGSERVSKTGASGQRLKEGAKINLSLSALGNVIAALVEGQSHIPYRTSKLTRLLQDSLGGNSKTVMIANVGPADYNYEETISTLRYADRAKQIKNRAHINEDPKDALLREFEKEIQELRRQLEEKDFDQLNNCDHQEDQDEVSSVLGPDDETLLGIRGEMEQHDRLASVVQSETESKKSALNALKQNVLTWKEQQKRKAQLEEQLNNLQKKIMVGGENLLDKSQEQEEYLQKCMLELDQRRKEQVKLQNSLATKMAMKAEMEAKVVRLQEAVSQKKKELRAWSRILKKEQLEDAGCDEEVELEKEALAAEIYRVELRSAKTQAILDRCIPPEYLAMIKEHMTYNPETRKWDIDCIAYTGNHVDHSSSYSRSTRVQPNTNMEHMYKSLADVSPGPMVRGAGDYLQTIPQRTSAIFNPETRNKILDRYTQHRSFQQSGGSDFKDEEDEDSTSEEEPPAVGFRR